MLSYSGLTIDDLDGMSHLYETYLNAGAIIRGWLREGLSKPDYAGVKCTDGDMLVGVFSGRPGVEFTCGHHDIVSQIIDQWGEHTLYTTDMVIVHPDYRGQGIARELAARFSRDLAAKGCRYLIIEEWHRKIENDVPVSGVLKYMGKYEIFGEYSDFYRELERYDMTCPECGTTCRCGAVVCVIDVNQPHITI